MSVACGGVCICCRSYVLCFLCYTEYWLGGRWLNSSCLVLLMFSFFFFFLHPFICRLWASCCSLCLVPHIQTINMCRQPQLLPRWGLWPYESAAPSPLPCLLPAPLGVFGLNEDVTVLTGCAWEPPCLCVCVCVWSTNDKVYMNASPLHFIFHLSVGVSLRTRWLGSRAVTSSHPNPRGSISALRNGHFLLVYYLFFVFFS